ncbi:MAG: hypothetical protein KBT31_00450 [Firmicutes bacterium]|nr:hypothetical protein [Candidatus Colimorpha enterica]
MMKKTCLIIVFLLLLAMPFTVSAENGTVPGGTVTDVDTLAEAFGGSEYCLVRENGIFLIGDCVLSSPVVIDGAELNVEGGGCSITSAEGGSLFVLRNGASLRLGNTAAAAASEAVILSGNNGKGDSLITVDASSTLTVCQGAIIENNISDSDGGAVFSLGTVIMQNGTISNCRSAGKGGAIYCEGKLTLNGGKISSVSASEGGAVYGNEKSEIMLTGTEILSASAENGGAVFSSGKVILSASSISGSEAKNGGAFYISGEFDVAGGQMLNCKASENGGALFNAGKTDILNGYISDCKAENGGAVFNSGELSYAGGYIEKSSAEKGGLIYNGGNFVHLDGNLASGTASLGGAVFNEGTFSHSSGSLLLNKADFGTAIFNLGTLSFPDYPYIDPKYDVFMAVNCENCGIVCDSVPPAASVARLTVGKYENGKAVPFCEEGITVITGSEVKAASEHFALSDYGSSSWKLVDGKTVRVKKLTEKPLFYILLVLAYIAVITAIALPIIIHDKKKASRA